MNYSGKIESLIDLLPNICELKDKTIVIKYGGAAMKDEKLTKQVIQDLVFLASCGLKLIIVHGGGPAINTWLKKMQIKPSFENGVRVTDCETMEIVEMVLAGQVNKYLVTLINSSQGKAVGLSGKDANILIAEPIDLSLQNMVGKITKVNSDLLNLLLDNNYIPILAPIALDTSGNSYNINADTAAGEIAASLSADYLLILTDTGGILRDFHDSSSLIPTLNRDEVKNLIEQKVIMGGMLPKVDCCMNALQSGVKSTCIIDGRVPHSILLSLLTQEPIGSTIRI
ncbi:acetylglutamate kinase [uncultured Thermosynechococcus sp.]|uniref:acetylglutamate kinase n=1 Tax=uncultured Thermosynechococcus sp. TaxID=436945 RepID=UPI00260BB8A1|nr:acetylglutamate kinase [uncultured Thermosynechococcus sp.]